MKNRKTRQKLLILFQLTLCLSAGLITTHVIQAGEWKKLAEDGLHDPEAAGLVLLQEPEEALGILPKDTAGNLVNWVKALRDKYIEPRSYLREEKKLEILDSDIILKGTGDTPYVLFPHKAHTEWLQCSNCHESLFISKAGETPITMLSILQGEYCGQCHGAVSFPLTECNRCHSVPQDSMIRTNK